MYADHTIAYPEDICPSQ